jgi:hypothetical protein
LSTLACPDQGVSLLRLPEGWTVSSPQRIVAQGTDWRSLNELKKEPKGSRGRVALSVKARLDA